MNHAVLSCYLTQRPDPQRGITWAKDDDAIVHDWIQSVKRVGLRGVILHDTLSESFCERWAGDGVSFEEITWHTPWTAAEERVYAYREWIADNKPDWVMTTDISDVEFYRDPFLIMTDPNLLYIGIEQGIIANTCVAKWMMDAYGEVTTPLSPILNPGICGGSYATMYSFLSLWYCELWKAKQPTPPPHDICGFNRVIYREKLPFGPSFPLHTRFRANEGPDSGCAIKHK